VLNDAVKRLGAAFGAVACAALFAFALPALAQSGARALRIVVPFAPGGGREILARAFIGELGAALGEPVIVDSRPGAGGAVGTVSVAKSEPDGQTLILAAPSHSVVALITKPAPYDPIRDFAAVALIGTGSNVLMIPANLPARTVTEFVAYAKANPGKLNYASAGVGSATHFTMAYFLGMTGVDMVHIPYKSTQESTNDLLAGRIQATFLPNINAVSFIKDPRIRMLGISAPRRSKFFPGLQTIAEAGVPGFEYESWYGLLAPAATPQSVVDRIHAAMVKVIQDPVVVDRLLKQGIEPLVASSADFAKMLQEDVEKTARVVKTAGISVSK